jgi:16S rRNA (guanine527-N7)-methyltransferase
MRRGRDPLVGETGIAALVERYALSPRAHQQLRSLLRMLIDDPLAPTAVRDPVKVVADHFADSLVALELVEVRSATAIADLGAGAGLPGLPLAIALPQSRVVLVESSSRKCEFIERAVAECRLTNAAVVNARAEEWPDGLTRFDLVTARALAPLDVVVEYAAPLLRIGGSLVAWRGRREADAEAAATRAAGQLGLEPGDVRWVRPYPSAQHRHLHLMSKVMDTPPGFPRRPGMAMKRPLGARVHPSGRMRREPSDRPRR